MPGVQPARGEGWGQLGVAGDGTPGADALVRSAAPANLLNKRGGIRSSRLLMGGAVFTASPEPGAGIPAALPMPALPGSH